MGKGADIREKALILQKNFCVRGMSLRKGYMRGFPFFPSLVGSEGEMQKLSRPHWLNPVHLHLSIHVQYFAHGLT